MSEAREVRVAVLQGGDSSERSVSLRTGAAFVEALERLGYPTLALDLTAERVGELLRAEFDVALIALHGGLGENGSLQGLLEWLRVPYTGSGVLASALAMDKVRAKRVFESAGVPTPAWAVMPSAEAPLPELGGWPLVVKPPLEGSSVGVRLVADEAELREAVAAALRPGVPVLVEACIQGRELSIGFFDDELIGTVEIRPDAGFYDFDAKYLRGDTSYLIPAPLDAAVQEEVRQVSLAAWQALGCRGVGRVDVLLDADSRPWVLEANTVPGMTPTSLVPKMAAALGWSFDELVDRMVRRARTDAGGSHG